MRFAFISRMESSPWGGSEELWSQAAKRLKEMGHGVLASVRGWEGVTPPRLKELEEIGVEVFYRPPPRPPSYRERVLRKIAASPRRAREHEDWARALALRKPDLVLISEGGNNHPQDLCRTFVEKDIPFAIVMQAAAEGWWPTDEEAAKASYIHSHAKAVYFVSDGNRRLTRKQFLGESPHTEVVRNPFNVDYDNTLPWPRESPDWKLAFVGRLDPLPKGSDLLLEVLDGARWRARNLAVSFYGDGLRAASVRKYAEMLQLPKVRFCGQVGNIEAVWKEHHALVLPSRLEGLPLAVVEAMLCRRPCIVTDVGGSAELIEDNVTGFVAEAATVKHLDEAMERAWRAREHWREIGERAGLNIRASVPRDPAGVFASKLIALVGTAATGIPAAACGK